MQRTVEEESAEPTSQFRFSPYVCREPSAIPSRPFLYEPVYVRKFTTGTVAMGAVGKTGLVSVEALALATGLPLLGIEPRGEYRVAFWNGEDPMDELDRSFAGARMHFGITEDQIGGRLFVDSGRTLPIVIAKMEQWVGAKVAQPQVDALVEALKAEKIDVLILDPFVSTHSVPENDNGAMDMVVRAWNEIAEVADCSVHLVFHTTKISAGKEATAGNLRGAVAAINKLRYARVLNRMNKTEAKPIGVDERQLSRYVCADDSEKSNLLAPGSARTWFQLVSVDLGNADVERDGAHAKNDRVRVAAPWSYPNIDWLEPTEDEVQMIEADLGDTVWRKMSTSPSWVGVPIARAMGIDLESPSDKKRITKLVKRWAEEGVLVDLKPDGSDKHGNKRDGYVWRGRGDAT